MSLAIRWGSNDEPDKPSGFIYFDVVTSYTQEYRGQVTKHPVDRGASITDHFIKENPVYNVSGVITGVDISPIPALIRDSENNIPVNAKQQPDALEVVQEDVGLLKFLPDSIGQFLNFGKPSIKVMDTSLRIDATQISKNLIIKLLDGYIFNESTGNFESYIQTVSLYEFTGTVVGSITHDLVITSFKVREDESTGEGLYFDATLERVTFVTLERAEIPSDVVNAAKPKNKGKADSTVKPTDTADGTQPKKEPVALSVQLGDGLGRVINQGSGN